MNYMYMYLQNVPERVPYIHVYIYIAVLYLTSSRGAGANMSEATAMSVRLYCSIPITELPGVWRSSRLEERLAWNIAVGSGEEERREGRRGEEGGGGGRRGGRGEGGGTQCKDVMVRRD